MSTSPLSYPQRLNPVLIIRWLWKQSVTKQLAIVAGLAIFAQGCADLASQSAYLASIRIEEAENIYAQRSQADPVQEVTEPPSIDEPLASLPQGVSVPTRFPLPAPQFSVDLTSTPTPFPPATREPTATEPSLPAPASGPTPTGLPAIVLTPPLSPTQSSDINHVVIISIDGLRPDALELADTPTLDLLKARGAYSPNAKTVSLSATLPSHAAMLSGMTMEKNGVHFHLPYIGWPGMNGPTLFSVAHDTGLSTATVFGKEELIYVVLPNSVDKLSCAEVHDTEVKDRALEFIEAGLPNILFIHFPDTDRVGHDYGWMSSNQLYAINFTDGLIGNIVTTLEDKGYLNNTLLIITADHGGHGNGHGDDSPPDRTIPWLAVGPSVPPGVILTSSINTYDTAATAAYALDLTIPEKWDGQPILEIFQ